MPTATQLKTLSDRIALLEKRFQIMSEVLDAHLECIQGLRHLAGNVLVPKLPPKKKVKRAHRRE